MAHIGVNTMKATYTTSLSFYTRNAAGILVKTVLEHRQGHNAKAMHIAAQWALNDLIRVIPAVICVEVYTCLESGNVRGYGQPFERSSNRYREQDRWTHTDF